MARRGFTKYPSGYIKASTDNDIKFYEIELANVDGDDDLEPDADDTFCMCILGKREPSIKEAEQFLAEDMKMLGYNCVVFVAEITPDEAYNFYDMTKDSKYPIFSSSCITASRTVNHDVFQGRIPKNIKDRTIENMEVYYMGLADAFEEACRELAPKGSELWKAWYYNDYRKFIPSAYIEEYLDFDKYPLEY